MTGIYIGKQHRNGSCPHTACNQEGQNRVAVLCFYSRAQGDHVDRGGFKKEGDPGMDLEKRAKTRKKNAWACRLVSRCPQTSYRGQKWQRAGDTASWKTPSRALAWQGGRICFAFLSFFFCFLFFLQNQRLINFPEQGKANERHLGRLEGSGWGSSGL